MNIKTRVEKLENKLSVAEPVNFVILYPADPGYGKADPRFVIQYPGGKTTETYVEKSKKRLRGKRAE